MYVRTRIIRSVGMDDYVMLLALALSISGLCIVIPEVQYGAGRHFAHLQPERASTGLELNFITQPIYLRAITVVKLSIAFFFLRIAPFQSYGRFLYGSIVFLIVYPLACFFTIIFQCKPLNILWDGPAVKAVCFTHKTLRTLGYVNVCINIVTDFFFASLPVPLLWHVQMNRRAKIALAGVMGLGSCVAAVVKASVLGNYGKTGDFLWDSAPLTIWTCIECNTGIIAASIPSMQPLFKTLIEKTLYSSNSQSKKKGYYMRQESGHSLQTFGGKHASDLEKDGPIITTASLSREPIVHELISISDGSILPLPGSQHIIKTTEIRVTRGSPAYDAQLEGMERTAGGEAALPERRIEDRV